MVAHADGIAWETSLDQARARARREGKALLLDYRAVPTSATCAALDAVTYLDPRVAAFIRRHLVPVRVRVRARPDVAARWAPIVVVGDGGAEDHYRVDGSGPAADFVAQLGLALGRYRFDRHEFAEAIGLFAEVADRHEGGQAAAQARLWLGIARYEQSTDRTCLRSESTPSPSARTPSANEEDIREGRR